MGKILSVIIQQHLKIITTTSVLRIKRMLHTPDSKTNGANMGPTWDLPAPDGPHVGPINLSIRDVSPNLNTRSHFHAELMRPQMKLWYIFSSSWNIWWHKELLWAWYDAYNICQLYVSFNELKSSWNFTESEKLFSILREKFADLN